jgi:hypothetical protein
MAVVVYEFLNSGVKGGTVHIWRTVRKVVACTCIVGSLAACGGGGGGSSAVSIPVATKTVWQADGNGFEQFTTNDSQYYGFSMWQTNNASYEAETTTVTATVKKESGAYNYGYGIVFGYQDSNNFYRLLIDTVGHYTLSVKLAGIYVLLIPWSAPTTATINPGFDVANVISVTQQTPHNFTISFNGVQETQFTDGNFSGGVDGFYASMSPTENFPAAPVDVRFKLTSPVNYPALVTTGLQAASAPGSIEGYEFGAALAGPVR